MNLLIIAQKPLSLIINITTMSSNYPIVIAMVCHHFIIFSHHGVMCCDYLTEILHKRALWYSDGDKPFLLIIWRVWMVCHFQFCEPWLFVSLWISLKWCVKMIFTKESYKMSKSKLRNCSPFYQFSYSFFFFCFVNKSTSLTILFPTD